MITIEIELIYKLHELAGICQRGQCPNSSMTPPPRKHSVLQQSLRRPPIQDFAPSQGPKQNWKKHNKVGMALQHVIRCQNRFIMVYPVLLSISSSLSLSSKSSTSEVRPGWGRPPLSGDQLCCQGPLEMPGEVGGNGPGSKQRKRRKMGGWVPLCVCIYYIVLMRSR